MPEHFITHTEASQMTATFQAQKDTILDANYQGRDLIATCETFDRAAIDALLSQPACVQVRIYYGMNANFEVHAIMVGVDANGDDLLPAGPNDPNQQIIEGGMRCPITCPRNLL